ncbi:TetR/AcrR family transcriptional regulator [Amycolatopsis azurea]|uniref:TetR/AcrR family transcriptional regulator n=1 Tax=Amycolatopsis azurea TaxID=36819 RepID=UPI00381C9FA5
MPDVKHFDPDAVLDAAVRLFWRQGVNSTGVQDIVTATGINRSSLYSTFGDKRKLYLATLNRYVTQRSQPVLRQLIEDTRGLPAISAFFEGLITTRCSGEYARWGCMVSNAHANGENEDRDVRAVLQLHHDQLRAAMCAALDHATSEGQVRADVSPTEASDMLALLAYGVNLRSRAGAEPVSLKETVAAAIRLLTA